MTGMNADRRADWTFNMNCEIADVLLEDALQVDGVAWHLWSYLIPHVLESGWTVDELVDQLHEVAAREDTTKDAPPDDAASSKPRQGHYLPARLPIYLRSAIPR